MTPSNPGADAPAPSKPPHPYDVALGRRIRQRRKELGYSQGQLARHLGISFQQVQKYEHGVNRVSYSRLAEIAQALHISVSSFVSDLEEQPPQSSHAGHVVRLSEPSAAEMADIFSKIKRPDHKRAIIAFAKHLVEEQADRPAETNAA